MTEQDLASTLKQAGEPLLDEIFREAEDRLQAQLQSAIAADQRAMTFLGFLLTLVAFLVGASLAAATGTNPSPSVAILSASGATGFIISSVFAYIATRPINFEFVGNDPASWAQDIINNVTLHDAKAEQCAHYDEMLKSNRSAMAKSSRALRKASLVAGGTVVIASMGVIAKIWFNL